MAFISSLCTDGVTVAWYFSLVQGVKVEEGS